MTGLSARITVSLVAITLVGLAAADVAFLVWSRSQLHRQDVLTLEAATHAAATRLYASSVGSDDLLTELRSISENYRVSLSAVDHDGAWLLTGPLQPPQDQLPEGVVVLDRGTSRLSTSLSHPHWDRLVASSASNVTIDRALQIQRQALVLLAAIGCVMVLLGLFFLRRSVVRPIARLMELVGSGDYDALARFGSGSTDTLSKLGRGIIGMTQTIQDDRTQIKQQLEKIRSAHAELEIAQNQVVRAERLAVVGQLAAGLAHEIGNPLTVLGGYVDMLRDSSTDPKQRKAMISMEKELDRIQVTVRNLLDFSRAQDSAVGTGDVGAVLKHVSALMKPQDRMRDIELHIRAPDSTLIANVATDALTQALLNLLLNAADAINGKGKIRIEVNADGDHRVAIVVDDSGPGIPDAVMPRLFEPFFTTKRAGKGTGLGLSVCERIITSAGGDIRVERGPLGGARFTLLVLRAPAQ